MVLETLLKSFPKTHLLRTKLLILCWTAFLKTFKKQILKRYLVSAYNPFCLYETGHLPGQRLPKQWFRHTLAGSDRRWQPMEIVVSCARNWTSLGRMETHIDIVSRAGTSNIKLSDSNLLGSCSGKSVQSCTRPWAKDRVVGGKGYLSSNCSTGTGTQMGLRA